MSAYSRSLPTIFWECKVPRSGTVRPTLSLKRLAIVLFTPQVWRLRWNGNRRPRPFHVLNYKVV